MSIGTVGLLLCQQETGYVIGLITVLHLEIDSFDDDYSIESPV